ncbi:MAG: CarD family transcriptional regulator [Clostridia bacterium]|nr:CarD family transcriptional regulator [Clostridia bacterium]
MFDIGDTVLYGATGVCKIDGTVEREIFGEKKEYFVLKPVSQDKSTVFVPTDNEALRAKMRKILSADEIDAIIKEVKTLPDIWEENDALRREMYSEIIHSGDRKKVMLLIRTLYTVQQQRYKEGKRLHLSDDRFLSEAERLLYDEFSIVLGIENSDVVPYIIAKTEK